MRERFDIRTLPVSAGALERDHGIPRRTISRARKDGATLYLADRIAVALGRHVDELPRWNQETP